MKVFILSTIAALAITVDLLAQQNTDIRLNQVGFAPKAPKFAAIVGGDDESFVVKHAKTNQVVFKGKLGHLRKSPYSGRVTRMADFSKVTQEGQYRIEVPGRKQTSYFEIRNDIFKPVAKAALKGFYFQRASTVLPEIYAGKWARPAAHADDRVLIHPSAVSQGRDENYTLRGTGGWYDAGDYNKSIVNSGITMGTLLSFYEDFSAYANRFEVDIPENRDAIPDLLNEALWNLRWMFTMQDPSDGGVYHKLTNPRFDGIIMPKEAKMDRYVVQKSTAAALDFVAVMAQSARIFKNFEKQLPGLADSCATAAQNGWKWAKANPDVLYDQDAMNEKYDPDVVTGAYGDKSVSDEWIWAAAEMYSLTGDSAYMDGVDFQLDASWSLPGWNQVKTLGYYTLLRTKQKLDPDFQSKLQNGLVSYASSLKDGLESQPYHTAMGKTPRDYAWGSSSVAANQGIVLLTAYRFTKHDDLLHAALGNMDYLMGRNATGYCFLTGFGTKRVMHPHHRISMADGIQDPIPGLLSGGPNPGQQDKCDTYPNRYADESFTDDDRSYASNEIAINWNAPMVYLAAALDAIYGK